MEGGCRVFIIMVGRVSGFHNYGTWVSGFHNYGVWVSDFDIYGGKVSEFDNKCGVGV